MPGFRYALNAAAVVMVALSGSIAPAHASGEVLCSATDGSDAEIYMVVGRLPILHVANAVATDGTTDWMINPEGDARPIVFGQGFMDDRVLVVDFTDPNVERVVVSLRVFRAGGDKSFAEAGVLSFDGGSVFPVQCEGG